MENNPNQKSATSPTLVSSIADRLRVDILAGKFGPGDALREIPLSEQYGTSRQTVREALRALSEEGLIDLISRRGARIPVLSPNRAREVYTLRALVEPFALRTALVGGMIRQPEMKRIEDAFQCMVDHAEKDDVAGMIEADMDFHWELCSPCGHTMLLDILKRLQAATRQSMVQMKVYNSDPLGEVESHTPILFAVRSRDADGAAVAMRDHINTHGERLLVKMVEGSSKTTA